MSTKFIRFVAVLAILVSIVGTTGVARANPAGEKPAAAASASPATSPWFVGWADKSTSVDVGSYPSIAYSPIDGLPYISYYDATNHHLMLASPVLNNSSDNTCLHTSWYCRVVDGNGENGSSTDAVGQYSSIAFWQSSTILGGWKLGISYYDSTTKALKLAVWSQNILGGSWSFSTISSGSVFYNPGTYTSLKFETDGTAQIAYYAYSSLTNTGYLDLATSVASGGNCGVGSVAGKWQCDAIDSGSGAGVGQYAGLGLGYNNVAYIAYYDAVNTNLKYAHFAGVGFGNCGPGNSYDCMMIAGSGADAGLSAALTAPISSTDHVRIAYYDKTNGQLKYATPSSGGNCGGGAWQCDSIHSMGVGLSRAGISMALDKNGNPIIAYEDASNDPAPSTLSIARPASAVDEFVGNCGPVALFYLWQCDTVDNAAYGSGYVNVAAYTSVAVSPSGLGTIAYFETDDYYIRNNLKVAFQRLQVFLPLIKR